MQNNRIRCPAGFLLSLAMLLLAITFSSAHAAVISPSEQVETDSLPAGWRAGFITEPVFDSRIYVVEAGLEHRQSVILIHGLGQNAGRDWRALMPALSREYHVVALDLPGFGRSEAPTGRYSPSHYARVVHALQQRIGAERVHVLGHSMGGAVALRYAADYAGHVDKLVLISVAGVLERSVFAQHSTALPLATDALVDLSALPDAWRDSMNQTLRGWGGNVLRLTKNLPDPVNLLSSSDATWNWALEGRAGLNAALALVEEDYSSAFEAVSAPVLIIWGEDDPVAPLRTGKLLAGQLQPSSFLVFPGMGHLPMKYPDKINAPILSFLKNGLEASSSDNAGTHQGNARCRGDNGLIYRGSFDHITLNGCRNIRLEDVQAKSIKIINSDVTMLNVKVNADSVALDVTQSKLRVTNGVFRGNEGVRVSASDLDLAGVHIKATQSALTAKWRSELVFSVSSMQTPDLSQTLHGIYTLGDERPQ